jgi:hypothetical protein
VPIAIIDGIPAGIRRDQERVIPVTVEQRRQSMRFVVIVEKDFCVITKSASVPELVDFEDVIDARCVVTQKLAGHVTARTQFDILCDISRVSSARHGYFYRKWWEIRYG